MSTAALFVGAAKQATDLGGWIGSTVRTSDYAGGRWSGLSRRDAQALLPRATQYVMICARLRASIQAGVPMRLYRPAGSSGAAKRAGAKSRAGTGVLVKSRARNAYLRDPIAGPGVKAVTYAEQAGDVEEVLDHPVLDLQRRPNPWCRGSDFDRLGHLFRLIFGNEFVHYAYEGRRGDGPTTKVHMAPQHTRIIPDPDTFIRGYVYGRDGSIEDTFAPDEVWHYKHESSPFDPYSGISPLHDVILEADTYAAAALAELCAWQNGAEPRGVWTVPPETSQPQIDQLDAYLNNRHRGPRNNGRFHIAAMATFTPIQRTPKEMEYLQGKHDLRKTIRNAYGIPESVTDLNDANLASSTTGNRQFMEQTIRPALALDAEDKTETMLRAFGIEPGEMWFAYDNPVPADKAATQARNVAYVGAGILNIDEARAEEGYEPLPDGAGEVFRVNGVPLDKVGVLQTPPMDGEEDEEEDDETPPDDHEEPAPAEDDDEDGDAAKSKAATPPAPPAADPPADHAANAGCACGDAGCGACGGDHPVELSLKAAFAGAIRTKDDDDDDRLADPDPLDVAMRSWFRSLLPGVFDAMNRGQSAESIRRAVLEYMKSPEVQRSFLDAVADPTLEMFAAGYDDGVRALGLDKPPSMGVFDIRNEAAERFLSEYRVNLAGSVTDTTADLITEAVKDGIANGEGPREIADRLKADWPTMSDQRAENIARTETARAFNEGKVRSWEQSGVVEGKEIRLSANPCELCAAIYEASKTTGLKDSVFPLGSVLSAGGRTYRNDYRDIKAPPFHPQCRCGAVPVLRRVEG